MGLIQQEFSKIKNKDCSQKFWNVHSLINLAGNEIIECLNIKDENSWTDQVKGCQARVSGLWDDTK